MRRFLFKSALLVGLIVICQVLVYEYNGGDKKFIIPEFDAYRQVVAEKPDIVFFADSVNYTCAPDDRDRRSIAQMIQSHLPNVSIAALDHGSYQSVVYRLFVQELIRHRALPPRLIVPINMRSFSTGWQARPEYQFVKLKTLVQHDSFLFRAFYKPLAVFKAFQLIPITESQYESMPVMDGDRIAGPVSAFTGPAYATYSPRFLKNKFIYNYMYKLSRHNLFVAPFQDIARLTRNAGTNTVFVILPVDYQTGEKTLGPRFTRRLKYNVDVIKAAMADEHATVLDLSTALPASAFTWRPDLYPNEHLNETGRAYVAKQLAAYF
jgi:hypothetical protein